MTSVFTACCKQQHLTNHYVNQIINAQYVAIAEWYLELFGFAYFLSCLIDYSTNFLIIYCTCCFKLIFLGLLKLMSEVFQSIKSVYFKLTFSLMAKIFCLRLILWYLTSLQAWLPLGTAWPSYPTNMQKCGHKTKQKQSLGLIVVILHMECFIYSCEAHMQNWTINDPITTGS